MQKDTMDKSLFFITLSCVCVWLIVDMAIGKNYLGKFLSTIFPFMDDSATVGVSEETTEGMKDGTVENAPSSSAGGSNNKGSQYQTTPGSGANQYGVTRKGYEK